MEFALVGIAGVAVVITFLVYLSFRIEAEKHRVLQLFFLMFAFLCLLFVPKFVNDAYNVCDTVVANSTWDGANFTSYEYTNHCYVRTESTPLSFMRMIWWLFYIFIAYMVVFLVIWVISLLKERRQGGKI